jgi:threonylcarbamoyladenosine tRNA methylthiotransferase MtaB
MNRHYTTEEYAKAVELLRSYYDDPALTTDVIVGFVGETEEEFEKTRKYLEMLRLYEMHIFRYSMRKGTRAEKMKGHVPEKVKADRSAQLIALSKQLKTSYEERVVGTFKKVLLEEETVIDGQRYMLGYTDRYVRIAVKFEEKNTFLAQNTIVVVKVEGFMNESLLFGKVSIEF